MRPYTVLSSNLLLGIVLFIFSVLFPPFDNITTLDLSSHMLQHFLIGLSGALIAYPYFYKKVRPGKTAIYASFIAVCALIIFWHLPEPWDSAVLNPYVHALEHASFLLVGIIIGGVIVHASDNFKILALLLGFAGHEVYAVYLLLPGSPFYPLYSYQDQYLLGLLLLLSGSLFLVGTAYIISNNPEILQGLGIRREKKARKIDFSFARFVSSIILIAVLVSYFGATGYAITKNENASNGTIIYIEETPYYWNYVPSRITVVIGVNNTVTWISRSFSYDTVTGTNSSLSSGPIPPGGKFTYTFTKEGVYEYHCIYHPWMVGYVVVKS